MQPRPGVQADARRNCASDLRGDRGAAERRVIPVGRRSAWPGDLVRVQCYGEGALECRWGPGHFESRGRRLLSGQAEFDKARDDPGDITLAWREARRELVRAQELAVLRIPWGAYGAQQRFCRVEVAEPQSHSDADWCSSCLRRERTEVD